MTIAKQIELARSYLKTNPGAYARLISGSIRSAMSDRAVRAFRDAVMVDGTEQLFNNFRSATPTAKEG